MQKPKETRLEFCLSSILTIVIVVGGFFHINYSIYKRNLMIQQFSSLMREGLSAQSILYPEQMAYIKSTTRKLTQQIESIKGIGEAQVTIYHDEYAQPTGAMVVLYAKKEGETITDPLKIQKIQSLVKNELSHLRRNKIIIIDGTTENVISDFDVTWQL